MKNKNTPHSQVESLVQEIFDGNYDTEAMIRILTHIKLAKEARSLGVLGHYIGQVYSLAPTALELL